jgi:16S rRNA processing protein RimM
VNHPGHETDVLQWDAMVVVGRVARTHGLRGQVIVNPETDFLEDRFRAGSVLYVRQTLEAQPLVVTAVRFHQGRPILSLEGIGSIQEAERLAGAELRVPADAVKQLPADEFYRHELVGCRVRTTAGLDLGTVAAVEGPREGSRLVVRRGRSEVLVPLAADICIEIDTRGRSIVIEPPEGLLDLNQR